MLIASSNPLYPLDFGVGDRVDSIRGAEHRGTVSAVKLTEGEQPLYQVTRDSDGFVWVGWFGTMLAGGALN